MIKYRVKVLDALRSAGFSSYRIRKEQIFGQRTMTQLRNGEPVTFTVLDKLCDLLHCQPGDLLIYEQDPAGDPGTAADR